MYSCKNCGGTMPTPKDICPHCGVLLSGVECENCAYTDRKEVFIKNNHCCPKCGSVVYLPQTAKQKPLEFFSSMMGCLIYFLIGVGIIAFIWYIPTMLDSIQERKTKRKVKRQTEFFTDDRDNKIYKCIQIGDQIWMAENLNVDNFCNGDPIPYIESGEEWTKAGYERKPAWCYKNNDHENGKVFGKLYNWYALNDPRGLAPTGWHVPSKMEWDSLILFLEKNNYDVGDLIEIGTSHWSNKNEDATNKTGFTALPGGERYHDSIFYQSEANFWSTTAIHRSCAWYLNLDEYNYRSRNRDINLDRGSMNKGYSVRCLKGRKKIEENDELFKTEINSFTDSRDAKVYNTVIIGQQEWMVENLNADKFCNGDPIPQIKSDREWEYKNKPAWCYYDNDPENGKVYGKLYNWYAVNDPRGLAPEGWHVPSDEEWTILEDYLCGKSVVGGKLKAIDTILWQNTNIGATNSSGFTALPGGCRDNNGKFSYLRTGGIFWSSSERSYNHSWYRYLYYNYADLTRENHYKSNGFSVRCLRDIVDNDY